MLTNINTNKYPSFDLLEIVAEPDLPFRTYQTIKPLQTGNYLPDFTLQNTYAHWQHFYNGAETHGVYQLSQLLSKPLVISFYSPAWQQQGADQLKRLNSIQAEIRANGGNLLVITSGKDSSLEKLAWEYNISLNFYFDAGHHIAQSLRIYSDADPVWNKFSGINVNVPLPATYVLDTNRQVIYDNVQFDPNNVFYTTDIISAVYNASLAISLKQSA